MDDSKGGSHAVHISPEQVQRFCEFLYRRTGMSFTESKRYFIDRRLEDRIAATGPSSFQEYFSLLRTDADQEIEHLINSFTVNETYFYREEHQLRCMTTSLLDAIVRQKKPGTTLRIWSIPCSTGSSRYWPPLRPTAHHRSNLPWQERRDRSPPHNRSWGQTSHRRDPA
jgi:chemotaxis protein methyltransferase CheR